MKTFSCFKDVHENDNEAIKHYQKKLINENSLQITKIRTLPSPLSEEKNQGLQQPQICNQDNKEKTNHSIFLVGINKLQQELKLNQLEKIQDQDHNLLSIAKTKIYNLSDKKTNQIIVPDSNSFDNQAVDYFKKCNIQKPELIQQIKEFSVNSTKGLCNYKKDTICKYCDQWVSQNYIILGCQHIYCIDCFKEELRQQCLSFDCIKFYCRCTIKISEKTILQLKKDQLIPNILNRLRINQLRKLASQVQQQYKTWTCPNKYCSFICIIQDNLNINLFYCPNCLCQQVNDRKQ